MGSPNRGQKKPVRFQTQETSWWGVRVIEGKSKLRIEEAREGPNPALLKPDEAEHYAALAWSR